MNSIKLAAIATVVAFVLVSVANADDFQSKPKPIKVVTLTFAKAMSMPGLVNAMYQQLDPQVFFDDPQHLYVAEVTYQGTLYRITGTLEQWVRFFFLKGDPPFNSQKIIINT
jgi:hypothetical protein